MDLTAKMVIPHMQMNLFSMSGLLVNLKSMPFRETYDFSMGSWTSRLCSTRLAVLAKSVLLQFSNVHLVIVVEDE
jgi:hypothetical protein